MRRKKIELSRSEMVAVRLVDAINLALSKQVLSFAPMWGGFKLELTEEKADNEVSYRKLIITPAGWPKGSVISCLLVPKDGWYALDNGQIHTPHLGNFRFFGYDHSGGGEKPRPDMVWVTIHPNT